VKVLEGFTSSLPSKRCELLGLLKCQMLLGQNLSRYLLYNFHKRKTF